MAHVAGVLLDHPDQHLAQRDLPATAAVLIRGIVGGDVETSGLVTKAGVRIGPAQMNASVIDEGRGNFAFFPLTMEIAHTGTRVGRAWAKGYRA